MDRLEGYRQALIDHQLSVQKKYIKPVGSYIANSYQVGKQFFSGTGAKPTAVFCYNDLVAIGLINALIDSGIQVPQQVSVIGFDNIEFGESARIPLTTVNVPAYNIGKTAAELLINQISNPTEIINEKVILQAKLVERNSCNKKSF